MLAATIRGSSVWQPWKEQPSLADSLHRRYGQLLNQDPI